jgi:uridine phosphorylase
MLIDGGPEGMIKTSWTACEYFNCGCGKCVSKQSKMDKKITAQWARETADSVLSKKVEAELEECEKKIEFAVSENKMTTTIYSFYGQPKTVQELESRGFKVKQHDDQREGSSLTISW